MLRANVNSINKEGEGRGKPLDGLIRTGCCGKPLRMPMPMYFG